MSGLAFPVVGATRISSTFGGRSSPGGIGSTNHKGLDIAAPAGSSVIAPTGLLVTSAGWQRGYGNTVEGVDAQGRTHIFAHLSSFSARPGDLLQQGQGLGAVGSTGNSTGNHLHYGIKSGGSFIDPVKAGLDIGKKAISKAADKAIGSAKQLAEKAIKKSLDKGADAAIGYIAGGPVGAATAVVGGNDKKSWIDEIKEWIKKSGFFQRIALALFAFILLIGAVYLMKANSVLSMVKGK